MEPVTDLLIWGLTLAALSLGGLAYFLLIRRRRRESDAAQADAATAETIRRRALARFRHLARWDADEPQDPEDR